MWSDNETELDYLNFSGTAKTVAEMIIQASGTPVSIGVSGQWGVGKSSLIKLVENELLLYEKDTPKKERKFIFVNFNAWLYQGFDDARAALMDVIATTLQEEAEVREKGTDKVKNFLKRVKWLRVAKTVADTAGAIALGLPPGVFTGLEHIVSKFKPGQTITESDYDGFKSSLEGVTELGSSFLSPKKVESPPKEIHELRKSFEEALKELEVTLVVFVDDLDRCLPETTISTLEAMRLFLFLNNTAFVIAADDKMIKHSVKRHFEGIEDDLVTNYFDKLIQVPIRVPALGTQEVKAYLFLLFIQNSQLDDGIKEEVRAKVCEQLTQSWKGQKLDKLFMNGLKIDFPQPLVNRIEIADRLAHIMTTSKNIKGNPRLIKRFLNALSIRMSISRSQGIGVDEAVLIKLLLFERCAVVEDNDYLRSKISGDLEGKPSFLKELEEKVAKGELPDLGDVWKSDKEFILDWLSLNPPLHDKDLRGALYVSREHSPMLSADDRLSTSAAQLLTTLLENPDMAQSKAVRDQLKVVSPVEQSVIMDKLISKAKQEEEWGVPKILEALIAMARQDDSLAKRFLAFLSGEPHNKIKAGLIPRLLDEKWAKSTLQKWKEDTQYSSPVRKAIKI